MINENRDPKEGSKNLATGLKARFYVATRWTTASYLLGALIKFASTIALTRLLAPDTFGVMSVGYMVLTGLSMLSDLGLNAGVMQNKRGDEPIFLNVTWIVSIIRGALVTVLAIIFSCILYFAANSSIVPDNSVFSDIRTPQIICALAFIGIITGFESTRSISARRRLDLALLTKIELICHLSSTILIVAIAYIHPSIWALVVGWLFSALLKTVLSHTMLPGLSNSFQWDSLTFREIFSFGKWIFLSSSLTFLISSSDRLILGILIDPSSLGLYIIALGLVQTIQAAFSVLADRVILPALSEVARTKDSELRETFYRIRLPLDALCLISAGGLFFLGDTIVSILYDKRYVESGWMLSILSLTLVSNRLEIFDRCLIAMGKVSSLTSLNAVRMVIMVLSIPIGNHYFGVVGAVFAVSCSAILNGIVLLFFQAQHSMFILRNELYSIPLFGLGLFLGWIAEVAFVNLREILSFS